MKQWQKQNGGFREHSLGIGDRASNGFREPSLGIGDRASNGFREPSLWNRDSYGYGLWLTISNVSKLQSSSKLHETMAINRMVVSESLY